MNTLIKISRFLLLSLSLFPAFIFADVFVPYPASGSISGGNLTTVGISSPSLTWNITRTGDLFNYSYTFSEAPNGFLVTTFVFQTGSSAVSSNFSSPSIPIAGVATINKDNGGTPVHPGLPANIYGIVLNRVAAPINKNFFTFSFTSPLAPMWGNVYAENVSGCIPTGCSTNNYTYNKNFLVAPVAGSASYAGWVPVPSNMIVPEPSTVILLGTAITAIFYSKRRKLTD